MVGKMKAARILEKNKIALVEADIPQLNPGEALVKVKYAGICGTDIHVLHGAHPTAVMPLIPGHEFVGEVVEVCGAGSERFEVGDHVVAQPIFACGSCESCAKGQENVCKDLRLVGVHMDGSFAQYCKVPTRKMYKIPKDMDMKLAALMEPLAVAVHDVRKSNLQVGESALIIGGGPIGILIAMVARQAGAGTLVISEISEYRRKFAEDLGFKTVNPLDADFDAQLKALTDGIGFNVVYEVSGTKPGIATAVDHCKITGNVVIIGMSGQPNPVDLGKVFAKELTFIGVRIHSQYNFIGAVELMKSGVINDELMTLVSKVFSIDDVVEAFDFAQVPGDYFKLLVEMN